MGVDINSHSGVVVTAVQLARIVRDENRERACRALLRHAVKLFHTLKKDSESEELNSWERQSLQYQAALLKAAFKSLTIESSVRDLRSMLKGMSKAAGDQEVAIWGVLINELHPNAPIPEYATTIDYPSPRDQGLDLPQGEVLYVFSEYQCFKCVKTEAGAALDEMLQQTTEVSIWANIS